MRYLLLYIFFSCLGFSTLAQPQAYYQSARYLDPQGTPYLDLIFNFSTSSLQPIYTNADTTQFCQVNLTAIIKNEQDSIIGVSKTLVASPPLSAPDQSFLHLQRIQVSPGILSVSIILNDPNKETNNSTSFTEKIFVDKKNNFAAQLSDLVFLGDILDAQSQSPFNRNGKQLIPYVNTFFPTELEKIMFYSELYHSKQQFPNGAFAYVYQILNPDTKEPIKDFIRIKRSETADVVPILGKMDISNLPSGKYVLSLEIRNIKNETIIQQEKAFYRENLNYDFSQTEIEDMALANSFIGKVESDSLLNDYIMCLWPIAEKHDKQRVEKPHEVFASIKEKQMFFLKFWMERSATQPSLAWYAYKKDVDLVDELFGTKIRRGYNTDRGRVYLQYGPPNSRLERPSEPVSYPYEIWGYDNLGSQSNIRFIFYNTNFGHNDYRLLHSDMRGEFRNPNWQAELQRRTTNAATPDPRAPRSNFGTNAKDFFDNPR